MILIIKSSLSDKCIGEECNKSETVEIFDVQPGPERLEIPIEKFESKEYSNLHPKVELVYDSKANIDKERKAQAYIEIQILNNETEESEYTKTTLKEAETIDPLKLSKVPTTKKSNTKFSGVAPKKCCLVLHPKKCVKVKETVKCTQKRIKECTDICTSRVVLISKLDMQPYSNSIHNRNIIQNLNVASSNQRTNINLYRTNDNNKNLQYFLYIPKVRQTSNTLYTNNKQVFYPNSNFQFFHQYQNSVTSPSQLYFLLPQRNLRSLIYEPGSYNINNQPYAYVLATIRQISSTQQTLSPQAIYIPPKRKRSTNGFVKEGQSDKSSFIIHKCQYVEKYPWIECFYYLVEG